MPQAEFQVGREEKHSISIDASVSTDLVRVLVDGKKLPADMVAMTGFVADYGVPSRRFMVGVKERHQIEVRVDSGVPPRIELFADGQLVPARSED